MPMTEEKIIDDYWTFRDLLRSVRISAPYVSPELTARISAALDERVHPGDLTEDQAADMLTLAGVLPGESHVLVEKPLRFRVIEILTAVK